MRYLFLLQLIESLRLAFADANYYVADPEKAEIPLNGLLSKEYAKKRAALIDKSRSELVLVMIEKHHVKTLFSGRQST